MPSDASKSVGDSISVSCMGAALFACRLYRIRLAGTPLANRRTNDTASTGGRVCRNCRKMEWEERLNRERARYEDGMRRLAPGQLLRLGNAGYGAGLCL